MFEYDFSNGKKRIENILNDSNEIEEKDKVPSEEKFTYHNGYYAWVTAVFVDIKESTKLFTENRKTSTSKIIRSFTSEIIEILRNDDNLREIGIRGDCVYAIYTTSTHEEDYEIASKTFYINTFLEMLNIILENRKMNKIVAGIGVSTAKELVVKAGREGSGINNLVWIGKAVTYASKFSSIANRDGYKPIIFSESFYKSMINVLCKNNKSKNPKSWFSEHNHNELGTFYNRNVVNSEFYEWIKGGMKNE